MKLKRMRRRAGGVIDRRGVPSSGGYGLGSPRIGGGGFPIPAGGGLVGLLIVIALAFVLPRVLGGSDPFGDSLSPFDGTAPVQPGSAGTGVSPDDPMGRFVDAVTDDVQTTWIDVFERAGETYDPTQVVLFTGATDTACGRATESVGPFYCPADRLVYLDTGFFRELEQRFGAPGDFAEAYVIAHEIGHHVQTLLGIESEVRRLTQEDPSRENDLSIRLELQADCFAGCGDARRRVPGSSSPATCRRGSRPPQRWATTGSRRPPPAASTPRRGRTARASSASSGSAPASRSGTPTPATPSTPTSSRGMVDQ